MVKIGREKTRPNTLVSAASVRGRTLADKVYYGEILSQFEEISRTGNFINTVLSEAIDLL